MKNILLALTALLITGSMCAEEYLYIEDFEVPQVVLQETSAKNRKMDVYIHAYFERYVSAVSLTLTASAGATVFDVTTAEDYPLTYSDRNDKVITFTPSFAFKQETGIGVAAILLEEGYYYPEGFDPMWDDPVCYGNPKWKGTYDKWLKATIRFDSDFTGGNLILHSECSSTPDPRGEVCPKTQESHICHISVEPIIYYCDPPELVITPGNDAYTIEATGEGLITLFINGEEVDNPYTIFRTYQDQTLTVTATSHINGLEDGVTSQECLIPALPPKENNFHIDNMEAFHGDTIVIPVQLTNEDSALAFQTDIYLPNGFYVVKDSNNELLITPSSRLTSDHMLTSERLNNGSVRVVCYSVNSRVISGNDGDIFYITVAIPKSAGGDYTVSLRNSLLTTSDYHEVNIPYSSGSLHVNTFIPGDVNDSRTVTVTDIVAVVQYILQKNPSPFIFSAADMNGDGNITVTDIMLIAKLIMTPAMNAPKRMPAIVNNDSMSGEDLALSTGETRTVRINLDNEMDYAAFQLDVKLPAGMTASNFRLTNRAGSHSLETNVLYNGNIRVLCYSPTFEGFNGHEGALLTFDVTATNIVDGSINVDGIELVTTDCNTVKPAAFTIGINNPTAINELSSGKEIANIEYFNLAGQKMSEPANGITIVVTTYTDGTRTSSKVIQ